MAYRPRRILVWLVVAILGLVTCGISQVLAGHVGGAVLLVGLVTGLAGGAGVKLNTNSYNPDE